MKKKVIFAGVIAAVPEPHLSEERTLFCELVVQAAHRIFRVQVKSSMQHLLYALAEPGDAVLCSGHLCGSTLTDARVFKKRASWQPL